MADFVKLETDSSPLQLNIAQTIFGKLIIDGTNYTPEIRLKKINDTNNVNISISFDIDVEKNSLPFQESDKYSLVLIQQPAKFKLTPSFEHNDGTLRLGLSFQVNQFDDIIQENTVEESSVVAKSNAKKKTINPKNKLWLIYQTQIVLN